MTHPEQVAKRFTGDARIVALLHDSIEDGETTEDELRSLYSKEVVDAVVILTRRSDETYMQYIDRVKEAGGIVLEVKLADLEVNLARCSDSLAKRYIKAQKVLRKEDR